MSAQAGTDKASTSTLVESDSAKDLRPPRRADDPDSQTLPPLPEEPYRSLAFYGREDRALFAGRDADIERFATYLDDTSTRILILHGESGVGKSSFLHAGVIPYLEEECLGYRFIRDREDESAGSVIFIRATNDLFGQLAQALCEFCARPYEYQTPLDEQVSADLPTVLSELIGDEVNQGIVRAALRSDPSLLGQIMTAISDLLPFTAILVIDQGEEIFTLAQTPEDQQRGRQALDMLRRTVGAAGNFKVIFCLRTEYYGRVTDRLRRGLHDPGNIREYLLTDFDEDDLLDAVRRPTVDVPVPYTSDVPFEKYGFRYADGVAEEIAQRLIRYTTLRRDSVLPLMQVICAQLYGLASSRADKTITLADLETLGGIEGGMRNHVESLFSELLKGRPLDKRPVQKLFTQLFLRQPDGTLTTALLAEDEVRKRWTGRMSFDELVSASLRMRLLKVNTLRIGMEEERRYVSLGHDALAKLAAEWDDELARSDRFRKTLKKVAAWAALAVAVAAVVSFGAVWMHRESESKLARNDVEQLMLARPDAVPNVIELLKPRKQYVVAEYLPGKIADEGLPVAHRIHAARALAEFQPLNSDQAQFLVNFIPDRDVEAADSRYLVWALKQHPDRDRVIKLLGQGYEQAEKMIQGLDNEVQNLDAKIQILEEDDEVDSIEDEQQRKKREKELRRDIESAEAIKTGKRGEMKAFQVIKVRWATALLSFGETDAALNMLELKSDPNDQINPIEWTLFIEHFKCWPGDPSDFSNLLLEVENADFRSGLCAAMATLPKNSLTREDFQDLAKTLGKLYRESPDSGTHSAAYCALKRWESDVPKQWKVDIPEITSSKKAEAGLKWYKNEVGMTMLLIQSKNGIDSYYVCDREVTQKEFKMFVDFKTSVEDPKPEWETNWSSRPDEAPMEYVSWNDSVEFCNWLSDREGLTRCYKEKDGVGKKWAWELDPEANGYRLPTRAEWVHACQAGTTTSYSFGEDESQLRMFGVFLLNSDAPRQPNRTASKLPNRWGLWDMEGNLKEFCARIPNKKECDLLDGSYFDSADGVGHKAHNLQSDSSVRQVYFGFRVARNAD